MGGINHQPCRHYLPQSTKLSRSMSRARADFEKANIALEDLILAELDGSRGDSSQIKISLSCSHDSLQEMLRDVDALSCRMDELRFTDLPTLRSVDWDEVGTRFATRGMVNRQSWEEVIALATTGGFRLVLSTIRTQIEDLDLHTCLLLDQVSLWVMVTGDNLHSILEENLPGNFKAQFASVYSRWAAFQQFFLASSLCSTEQWYVFMGYGSLVGGVSGGVAAVSSQESSA